MMLLILPRLSIDMYASIPHEARFLGVNQDSSSYEGVGGHGAIQNIVFYTPPSRGKLYWITSNEGQWVYTQ